MTQETGLRVPERLLPVPKHLSPQAQAFLSAPRPSGSGYPALDDAEAWRAHIAAGDSSILSNYLAHVPDVTGRI